MPSMVCSSLTLCSGSSFSTKVNSSYLSNKQTKNRKRLCSPQDYTNARVGNIFIRPLKRNPEQTAKLSHLSHNNGSWMNLSVPAASSKTDWQTWCLVKHSHSPSGYRKPERVLKILYACVMHFPLNALPPMYRLCVHCPQWHYLAAFQWQFLSLPPNPPPQSKSCNKRIP